MLNMKITFESRQGQVEIGDRAYIGGGSIICRERITIGSDVTTAWGVCIYDHNSNSFDWRQRAKVVNHFYENYGKSDCYEGIDWTGVASAPIVIEDKVWIGFDAVILKGVRVGEGAIVGARAVVTSDVEPYTVVAGNPARLVKRLEAG
jgi:galactoside O-acetyltransferase